MRLSWLTIDNCIVGEREAADLNRGRSYLREVAQRHGVRCLMRGRSFTDRVQVIRTFHSCIEARIVFAKVLTPLNNARTEAAST